MTTKIKDQAVKEFMKFFRSQGVKFVDFRTGKEIKIEEE